MSNESQTSQKSTEKETSSTRKSTPDPVIGIRLRIKGCETKELLKLIDEYQEWIKGVEEGEGLIIEYSIIELHDPNDFIEVSG